MNEHTAKEPNGRYSLMPTVIKPNFASTSNYPVPKYTICELTHAKKCNSQGVQQHTIKEKEVILAWGKFQAVDFVLMNQFVVSIPG